MVVFVDHDAHPLTPHALRPHVNLTPHDSCIGVSVDQNDTPKDPNRGAFSAALNCYPIVKEIARSLDLNTLHALSQTCRQIHANLLPFRAQLARQTLRCENEYIGALSDLLDSGTAVPDSVKLVARLLSRDTAADPGRLTRGKVGKCARDMVGECRRCSRVVCRNCTVKPPSASLLKNRIRHLCGACCTAPLTRLVSSPDTFSSLDPARPTATAFMRTPCTCQDAVWLCYQCGHTLRGADATYHRLRAYRGGQGTVIGGRCQDVGCARGGDCLGVLMSEIEIDGEADGELEEPTPFRDQTVGVGGNVNGRAVDDPVVGYEDDRATGRYLDREEECRQRSWCGWCWRVIPAGNEDVPGLC